MAAKKKARKAAGSPRSKAKAPTNVALEAARSRAAQLKKTIKAAKKELRAVRRELKAAKKEAKKRLKAVRAEAEKRLGRMQAVARRKRAALAKKIAPKPAAKKAVADKPAARKPVRAAVVAKSSSPAPAKRPLTTIERLSLTVTPRAPSERRPVPAKRSEAVAPPAAGSAVAGATGKAAAPADSPG